MYKIIAIPIPKALGIGAASFCSEAEKDIAESPTALAGTPKETIKYIASLCGSKMPGTRWF